jgi:hypothetical protein
MVLVVQMEQLQRTYEKTKNDGPPTKDICYVLGKYKDIIIIELLQELLPPIYIDHNIKVIPGSEPPSKALNC